MAEQTCPSRYVTERTVWYTDVVQCQKTEGHKKDEHQWTSRTRDETVTWTTREEYR